MNVRMKKTKQHEDKITALGVRVTNKRCKDKDKLALM